MRPGAAPALLGLGAAAALRDGRVMLEDVWQDEGRRLRDALDGAAASSDRMGLLLAALRARTLRAAAPDPLVRAAVDGLGDPLARVDMLACELGVSARQLRRRFEAAVGYGPKRLARVLRLQRAMDAARGGEELTRAAFAAGYADHAHFAHECRALAGAPATALV